MREYPLKIIKSSPFHGFGKILISGQSAGNLTTPSSADHKGSSETTCKASSQFIYWLIGFTEGDGSFIVNKNGYLEFKLTQSSKDAQILFYIKKNLGFGSVSKQDSISNTHHYRVRDKKGLFKIIEIFNGNLYLHHRIAQFTNFVNSYNKAYSTNIQVLDNGDKAPTLDNAWLSGFTDAEGCFTISIISNRTENPQITVRFIIPQKGEEELLKEIAKLLKGRVSFIKSYNGHNMTVNLSNLEKTITYFKNNKLKTKKLISYEKWLKIYDIVKTKKHLGPNPEVATDKIREMAKFIKI